MVTSLFHLQNNGFFKERNMIHPRLGNQAHIYDPPKSQTKTTFETGRASIFRNYPKLEHDQGFMDPNDYKQL